METDEMPAALITPAERWQDFSFALNALARFAMREAEKELTRERKRQNKADQRARATQKADTLIASQGAARLTG